MIYGTLDVYWPDAPSQSYQLDKQTIAIGRSSGNDIMLDASSISRYHISISHENGQAVLRDLESVNGTHVDGVKLKANDPLILRGGEEIQIGDLRLVYQPAQSETPEVSTRPMRPVESKSQKVAVAASTFRIELDEPEMPVTPGAHVQAALIIYNQSAEPQRFSVEVSGVPREWLRVDRPELEIGENAQALVTINFKPVRRSESAPGVYPINIRVISRATESVLECQLGLNVRTYSGFGMALANPRLDGTNQFDLYLHNQGSGQLSLLVKGNSPDQALVFELPTTPVVLGPGERKKITGTVKLRGGRLAGRIVEHTFDIIVKSQDASGFVATVPGIFVDKPRLSGRLFGGISVLVLLLLVAIVFFLTRPQSASIAAFAPAQSVGTTLLRYVKLNIPLTWSVQNAQSVRFVLPPGLKPDSPQLSADSTYPTSGNATFSGILLTQDSTVPIILVALGNDGQEKRADQTFDLKDPACKALSALQAFEGPDQSYPKSVNVAEGTTFYPDRTSGQGWIRASNKGGSGTYWLQFDTTKFSCVGIGTADSFQAIMGNEVTNTPTATATYTVTPSSTYTLTYTSTFTNTPTATYTNTATYTKTYTSTYTNTPTFSPTPSSTLTATLTQTLTRTSTLTSTRTPTATRTWTATPTITPSPTLTATPSASYTPSLAPNVNDISLVDMARTMLAPIPPPPTTIP